jgi:DNA-directed RNA polymerase specialized sigma24 family protein
MGPCAIADDRSMKKDDPDQFAEVIDEMERAEKRSKRASKGYHQHLLDSEPEMVKRWLKGESTKEIAKSIGCSDGRVNKAIIRRLEASPSWKGFREE